MERRKFINAAAATSACALASMIIPDRANSQGNKKSSPCKITVVKRVVFNDLYEEYRGNKGKVCSQFEDGQEFIVKSPYQVPEDWNFEHPFIFFDVYDLGTLEGIKGIKDNVHDISAWVYHPSQANEPPRLPDKIIEHWRKTEDCRLDFTTRKEHLEWQLANHPNKLWYKKLSKSL